MNNNAPTHNPKRNDTQAQPLAQINHSSAEEEKPDPDLGRHGPIVTEPDGAASRPSRRGAK